MERAVIVKGQLTDERHIELDEPIDEPFGPIEVTLRPIEVKPQPTDVEGLLRIEEEWRARNPDKLRSKEEIDRYIADERASWGDDE